MSDETHNENTKCLSCSRRAALKFGAGVALGLTSGASLPACGGTAELEGDLIVALSDYPDLANAGGIAFIPTSETGFPFSIIVINEGDETFRAMSAECNHLSCEVELSGGQFDCPCHGSKFTIEGELLNGPATADLLQFATDVEGDTLTISPA